jgi:hypothetical protein
MAKIANVDIRVERAEFDKSVKRLMDASPKAAREIVLDAAEAFIQAASKETPTMAGKASIPKRKYERTIIQRTNDDISVADRVALKLGRRVTTAYIVKYRTRKKQGGKPFASQGEAKAFAKIKFRGIARAGWFLGLSKIGKSLSATHDTILGKSPNIKTKNVNDTRQLVNNKDFAVEVTNQSDAIDRIAKKSEVWGLRKAKNKLNGAAKTLEKRMKEQWLT